MTDFLPLFTRQSRATYLHQHTLERNLPLDNKALLGGTGDREGSLRTRTEFANRVCLGTARRMRPLQMQAREDPAADLGSGIASSSCRLNVCRSEAVRLEAEAMGEQA